jgi:type IV pilus assembly protein PilB
VRKKIGEVLMQQGLITDKDLQLARFEQKRTSERLGAVLVRLKLITELQLAQGLSEQLGIPLIDLVNDPPEPKIAALVPKDFAARTGCIPCRIEHGVLVVAMADPLSLSLLQDLEFGTGYRVQRMIGVRSQIDTAIEKYYGSTSLAVLDKAVRENGGTTFNDSLLIPEQEEEITERVGPDTAAEGEYFEQDTQEEHQENEKSAPIIKLVDSILAEAVSGKASDIHIEPAKNGVIVRHRLDGILHEVANLPKWVHSGLVARIKVMGSMDIAEKRMPQDGRLKINAPNGTAVDFRVSSLNTLYGEKIVLRVLDHSKGVPTLESLGLSARDLEQLHYFLRHQHGMVLVVGPTGSGKSTTLSSALSAIKSKTTNIVTIEDPIEYQIAGVNQTQVNEKAKITFANSLRAILRQDPDIILVGEIRDQQTAQIAMQAAQTGHLVLSTLHTENAPSTVTRLTDMNVEPYIMGSALIGVVAQRLLRRLCTDCRARYTPSPEVLRMLNVSEKQASSLPFYKAVGCDRCQNTGYRGRIGIYEVMHVSDKIARLISQRAGEDAVRDAALESGMTSLGEDGLAKVKAGITSPEELLRVVTEVREIRTLCPECTTPVGLDFVACPQCGRRLGGGCTSCGRQMQARWNYCPYCASDAGRKSRQQEAGRGMKV